MGHRAGESRQQGALFPVMLDELVPADSLVRIIDTWVSGLDVQRLGFAKAQPQVRGAPPYHPGDLLKLYLWGYVSGLRSSRELERECHRNVECMWLLGRLAPDHKTIAEFRRTNTAALVASCAAFVQFARSKRLIAGRTVAVDGSKVRAVASRTAVKRRDALSAQAQRNAEEIERYLNLLADTDRLEATQPRADGDVRKALRQLQERQAQIQAEVERLVQQGRSSAVEGEDEARAMPSLHYAPGYNLQTAVDSDSHLIVAHAVSSEVTDQRQLQPMTEAVGEALQAPCAIVADAGYANGEQLAAIEQQGFTSFVCDNRTVNHHGGGALYDRTAFAYDALSDTFTCPAGAILKRRGLDPSGKLMQYVGARKDCAGCPLKAQCTTAKRRTVTRHIHEDALQANARRMRAHPEMVDLRRCTVEHPFDFVKNRVLRNGRLLMRGLQGATAELSLAVLAYNLKRMFNMIGGNAMRRLAAG